MMRGLYLVTDRRACGEKSLEEVVCQAVQGGVSYVQLREKNLSTRLFVAEAKMIQKLLEPFGVPLIINDRVDVALACGARGVHLGQQDMPCQDARRLMGKNAIIGLSVETWTDVEAAQDVDVNYIAVSPVFPTPTKTDTQGAWGLEGISRIKRFSRHPLVAIGGIHPANVKDVVRAGADCIACVSAICRAPHPKETARSIHQLIEGALKER